MNNERDGYQENDKYIPKHAYNGDINNFDRNNTYDNNDCYKVKNDIVLDENIYSDFDDNRDENIKVKSVKKKKINLIIYFGSIINSVGEENH